MYTCQKKGFHFFHSQNFRGLTIIHSFFSSCTDAPNDSGANAYALKTDLIPKTTVSIYPAALPCPKTSSCHSISTGPGCHRHKLSQKHDASQAKETDHQVHGWSEGQTCHHRQRKHCPLNSIHYLIICLQSLNGSGECYNRSDRNG